MFFCSYGTAGNKYLKVPRIRDNIVVEFKMQLTLRYDVNVCASVAVTSELGNNKYCREMRANLLKIDKRRQT